MAQTEGLVAAHHQPLPVCCGWKPTGGEGGTAAQEPPPPITIRAGRHRMRRGGESPSAVPHVVEEERCS
jgi:hypothetical protein